MTRRWRCPSPFTQGREFIERIIQIGERAPGLVLYPSSDDTAFLFAFHAEELSRHFRLHQPTVGVVYDLLNKERLYTWAREVGLDTPATWVVEDSHDLPSSVRYPLMLKPQTQVQFESKAKGLLIRDRTEAAEAISRYREAVRFGPEVSSFDPDVALPLVQRYHAEASTSILTLAGFVTTKGRSAVRASRKVLQRPRRFGVGVCFEAATIPQELVDRTLDLCRRVGYFGAFEAEFIVSDGRALLIDFNPRFYGEMAFEIARGLPLARLVYEAALGNSERVTEMLEASSAVDPASSTAYCHSLAVKLLLGATWWRGEMGAADRRKWRAWLSRHDGRIVDAVRAKDDAIPGWVDLGSELFAALRHPRAFVRSLAPELSTDLEGPGVRESPDLQSP